MRPVIHAYRAGTFLLGAGWMAAMILSGCGQNLDQETFNVYLTTPEGKEERVAEVKGLTQCREKAETIALYRNYLKWDYTCCLKTNTSDCAEKHK